MRLIEARPEELAGRVSELAECVENPECYGGEIVGFFRLVRDREAADLLLRLFERMPYADWIGEAIYFQKRRSDAVQVRTIADSEKGRFARAWLLELADRIEDTAP